MENLDGPTEEDRKYFENYLKEKRGQEIDPRAVMAGRREMEQGRRGGYPVYGNEPTREAKFRYDPEGSLYRKDISKEELSEEIKILAELKEKVISILENPKINLKKPKETTLQEFKDSFASGDADATLLVFNLIKYGFDYNTLLFDLPQMIEEKIKYDTRSLDRLKSKT